MQKLFRTNVWWAVIVPQVLGWIYFCFLDGTSNFGYGYRAFFCFFCGLVFTSAFGFLFNDLCDVDSDRKAGKANVMSTLHPALRVLLIAINLTAALLGWFYLQASVLASVFFVLQIVSLIVYSLPPFRFKNKHIAGVLTDAFYGHLNPVLITILVFGFRHTPGGEKSTSLFIPLLLLCTFLKGVRNILLHQLDDRKNDRKAGDQTFVVKFGPLFTLNLINKMLWLEIPATFLLVLNISYVVPPFFAVFLLFALVSYLKFSGWKLAYLPQRQLKFKFLYFLNDFYEGWMPVSFLLILAITHYWSFYVFLAIHLLLFPSFLLNLWRDIKQIRENFKTEDEY